MNQLDHIPTLNALIEPNSKGAIGSKERGDMIDLKINPSRKWALANPQSECCVWIDDFPTAPLRKLHLRYARRAVKVFAGRNRNVFAMSNGYVVKVPSGPQGFADNDWEGSVSNTPETFGDINEIQYPHTRLVYFERQIPILFMEYVEHARSAVTRSRLGFEPWWIGSVDGGQVGFNKHGRLVAYDYGLN